MWLMYLDESGIGNPAVEPNVVVAGVMVKADRRWPVLERYLRDMARDYAGDDYTSDFCFHAVDLVNGGKRTNFLKHPKAKRELFMSALCEVPKRFDLPIVCVAVAREKIRTKKPNASEEDVVREALQHASISCAQGAEQLLRKLDDEDELGMLVFEENGRRSRAIRDYHNIFRSDRWAEFIKTRELTNLLPFERIIDTAHFAAKADTCILQLADVCSYVFSRYLRGVKQPDSWLHPLLGQLMFGSSALSEARAKVLAGR